MRIRRFGTVEAPSGDRAERGNGSRLSGHFGPYGGRFVPEALVAALDELTQAYDDARADPGVWCRTGRLQTTYTGRPSPLTDARRFGAEEAGGARILLKREDLNHTGSHKINNVLGQALLTRRMGKPRVIAETGAGSTASLPQRPARCSTSIASSTWARTDTRRQALNVTRMQLLGAEVVPVRTGSRTLKDAINEAMRDWVTNVDTTHYLLGTVAGPHPFPAMVRDFHRIIGDEARQQVLDLTGRLPDAVAACVGGGSNAIGIFTAFLDDHVGATAWVRSRWLRRRRRDCMPRPSWPARPACSMARAPTCCRTRTGRRSRPTPSPPASTTRGSGPSTPGCTIGDGRRTRR